MTPHRPCLDNLTEAMALPSVEAIETAMRAPVFEYPPWFLDVYGQGPPRQRRQQGRIQDYGRRAG